MVKIIGMIVCTAGKRSMQMNTTPLCERCEAKKRLGLLKVKRVKRMQRI